jgi:hypothetical protein
MNYYYTRWGPTLARDILGMDVTECVENDTSIGLAGFASRIDNVAVSLTNQ